MTNAILKIRKVKSSYMSANEKFVRLGGNDFVESYERRQDGTATLFRMY